MTRLTRRHTLAGLGLSTLLSPRAFAKSKARIVIIGGGFGGATAAQTLHRLMPNLDITLIEPKTDYLACPMSNLVVSGHRKLEQQRFGYAALKKRGINIVSARAKDVDAVAGTVCLEGRSQKLPYDKLIMSPGIAFNWNAIEGYDFEASALMPHAWQAGPQTELLRDQLMAMPNGGVVAISVPKAPYRCPPGPYERACLIADYLKTHKPKSKLIILDAKDSFSKQPLFTVAWEQYYGEMIEWRNFSNDGTVIRVEPETKTLITDFDALKTDVANIIPPQQAGEIAKRAGVTDFTGWCPVDGLTFESRLQKNIYVIGDACIANPMPKSAFSAALQGKICALQIARNLSGLAATPTVLTNTCYSFTTPDQAVSISGVYDNKQGDISPIAGAGGLSPLRAEKGIRQAEARQAQSWFQSATYEAFG